MRPAGFAAPELEREIRGARKRLEEQLGREVSFFGYPYGQRDDLDTADLKP